MRNDRAAEGFHGTVTLTTYAVADRTGSPGTQLLRLEVSLPEGPGAVQWFDFPGPIPDANTTLLEITVADTERNADDDAAAGAAGAVVSTHVVTLDYPKALKQSLVRDANVTSSVATSVSANGTIDIALEADATALWVTLTTRAQGRFSDNAFLLRPGAANARTVQFIPFRDGTGKEDLGTLTSTLRVEHYAMYA